MRRSLGDKRRKIGEIEDGDDQIAEIVKLFGAFEDNDISKIFDNEDFGFTRVTVERPLRLRFQMNDENKARFNEFFPRLDEDITAIENALGCEPIYDWNIVWPRIDDILRERSSRWKLPEQKLFRSVFTIKDPDAEPVILSLSSGKGVKKIQSKHTDNKGKISAYEPDIDLRDFENIPLKDDIEAYCEREVKPHVPDAWMDRSKDKVGYEINFNRHFYKYTQARPLEEIDADLKKAEENIIRLLSEMTK